MIILVTGGAASGKSAYAEEISIKLKKDNLIYIATMMPYNDEECYKKINRHKEMRKEKGFFTIECPYDLKSIREEQLSKDSTVLLECLSNLLANEMYDPARGDKDPVLEIIEGINYLKDKVGNLIIVTNEIFSDGNDYDEETEKYINNLGIINRNISIIAEEVMEIVYGIEVKIK